MLHRYPAVFLAVFGIFLPAQTVLSQTLNLPPRPADALNATQFTNIIWNLPLAERENWIYAQVISGNIPGWLRNLKPISVAIFGHTATYYVTPDYLAVGSDADYFLEPCTPLLAQRLADALGCSLPTRRMVNQIWTNATVKLNPQPIPPSAEMITVPVFAEHDVMVRSQRDGLTNSQPLGALVSGDKKDVVISTLIYTNFANVNIPKPVVIYGWHYTDGTPIQPLYNGHVETYADYSHGIRLVQMNMVVDGVANTVTNVLKNPTLAPLLSDEGPSQGSTDGTIRVPRYTVAPIAPVVLIHPRSQNVLPGQTVKLSAEAVGDPPLYCRWLFNNGGIADSTNFTLVITNLQTSDAGNYSVIITNQTGSVTSRVAEISVRTTDFPVFFDDEFETDDATNWNIFWGAANGVPDYTVDIAFDYSATPYSFNGVTTLIPAAPGSPDGSTRGLKLTVNNNDATGATAAVNLYPKNLSVSGDFVLKFDLWMNYPGDAGGINSSGSTQFAIFGINHLGTEVNWAAPSATQSDGVWFAAAGEGGAAADYRAYVGNPGGLPIDLTGNLSASGLVATNNTATFFQTIFPPSQFETAGAPGKKWVEVELRQTHNIITWFVNGIIIAQRANTSPFTNGNIMIGLMDTFSSIASPARDSFILIDNIRVENLSPPIEFDNIRRLADGEIELKLTSALGDSFSLESSTNLTTWQSVADITLTNVPTTFVDTSKSRGGAVFYRARRP